MGWFQACIGKGTSTHVEPSDAYVGQDVLGVNDDGCPYIGQTIDHAVTPESLTATAKALGITITQLRALLAAE